LIDYNVIVIKPKTPKELKQELLLHGCDTRIVGEMVKQMAEDIRSSDYLKGYAPLLFWGNKIIKVLPDRVDNR
jgi:hypothetical protein